MTNSENDNKSETKQSPKTEKKIQETNKETQKTVKSEQNKDTITSKSSMASSTATSTSSTKETVTAKSSPSDKIQDKKSTVNRPKWSKALPFMLWPQNLDGTMAGDVGFDPLGFTNVFDVRWMREAELKHCRIAMLAALGFIVQELWTFPYPYFSKVPPVEAHDVFVKTGGMSQILLFVIFFEVISIFAVSQMMEGKREPGVFHFDPLSLAKDPETFRKYEWAELRNGRLAMIALGGFIHQYWVTKQGVLEQLANFRPLSP
eukprot:jgi/Galph1/1669/GphlegSOOS_G356.1